MSQSLGMTSTFHGGTLIHRNGTGYHQDPYQTVNRGRNGTKCYQNSTKYYLSSLRPYIETTKVKNDFVSKFVCFFVCFFVVFFFAPTH